MLDRINPNCLTAVRLFLAPIIMALLLHGSALSLSLCLALMLFAELTDFGDGYIARRYKKVSDAGKIFDPMCDTIYHLLIFLCLIMYGLPVWVVAIYLARDISVAYLRVFSAIRGYVMAARWSGKYKAVTQMISQFAFVIFLLSLSLGLESSLASAAVLLSTALAVMVTVYSFFDYSFAVYSKHKEN